MIAARLFLAWLVIACLLPTTWAQRRMTEDRDLIAIDLKGWDCLDQPGGSAKSADGASRNAGKNRPFTSLAGPAPVALDTDGFLKLVSAFDTQSRGRRRKDLTAPQQAQLGTLEKQLVSFTGYLVLAYAGPPESTNCGSVDFHDWHLEVFAQPADHAPRVGDPTPIICEITPRTQNALYQAGIRLRDLAAYIRQPDLSYEATGHPARKIRLTGYLLWDDDHNGSADVGPKILSMGQNGYHHPWRSTAWELHPIIKIEPLEGSPTPQATIAVAPAPPAAAPAAAAPAIATVLSPVRAKIAYGETVIPIGTRLEVLSHSGAILTVRYLDQSVLVPAASTDAGSDPP